MAVKVQISDVEGKELIRRFQAEIQNLTENVVKGNAVPDWAAYRHHVGMHSAYQKAIEIVSSYMKEEE